MGKIEEISTLSEQILNQQALTDAKQLGLQACTIAVQLAVEVERLTARAEALERAIRKECFYCNHNACKLPCGCINFNGWQFDQAQFSEKERDPQ